MPGGSAVSESTVVHQPAGRAGTPDLQLSRALEPKRSRADSKFLPEISFECGDVPVADHVPHLGDRARTVAQQILGSGYADPPYPFRERHAAEVAKDLAAVRPFHVEDVRQIRQGDGRMGGVFQDSFQPNYVFPRPRAPVGANAGGACSRARSDQALQDHAL